MGQGLWISFPGCRDWPHWCYGSGVVASLVWGLLWRVALAEGAAASASFCVTGCTEGCGDGSVFWLGLFAMVVSDWGGRDLWQLWGGFGFLGFFGGVCFCRPLVYGVFPLVVHPWGLCWVT